MRLVFDIAGFLPLRAKQSTWTAFLFERNHQLELILDLLKNELNSIKLTHQK